MDVLRTPDDRFVGLTGYDFEPHYTEVTASDGTGLRMHHIDEGPADGEVVLCLHGQPSWSFLYRKMVPYLTEAGLRVIAPDLVGFGRSDKPARTEDYTYAGHVDWLSQWLLAQDLTGITLFCQDWGGLIGLRVVAEHPDRFRRLVIANTGLPDSRMVQKETSAFFASVWPKLPVPDAKMVIQKFAEGANDAFLHWIKYAAECPTFSVRDVFGMLSKVRDDAVLDGYAAPFVDATYIAGARRFPSLVPLMPWHEEDRAANDRAWAVLEQFERPVLTAFSDRDPVTRGGEKVFQQRIPGAQGRAHVTIEGGGHFLQEDKPAEVSAAIIGLINETG